jgi:hypothetical protein
MSNRQGNGFVFAERAVLILENEPCLVIIPAGSARIAPGKRSRWNWFESTVVHPMDDSRPAGRKSEAKTGTIGARLSSVPEERNQSKCFCSQNIVGSLVRSEQPSGRTDHQSPLDDRINGSLRASGRGRHSLSRRPAPAAVNKKL